MARGGARRGAGRPKKTTEQAELELLQKRERLLALGDGLSPLAYMLRVLRNPNTPQARRDKMAIAAAPYCHPRLATHEIGGKGGGPIGVTFGGKVTVYHVPANGRRVEA